MATVLVVEDHELIRGNLLFQLAEAGHRAAGLGSAEAAWERLNDTKRALPDVMLLDIRLGTTSGVDLIRRLDQCKRLPPTIVVSGEATISETVEALRLGVYDFIEKPVSKQRLIRSVANCLDHNALRRKLAELQDRLQPADPLLGLCDSIKQLKREIAKVAPTDGRVLIRGESGTGKELVAAMIFRNSKRAGGPYVKINCAAIPPNLVEDELFGHVRGAFTDARSDKAGLFEEAHGGTLFLDEIGDMDVTLQARLLRVLEDGVVRRIGDSRERKVDIRLITATHRPIQQLIRDKKFREDLYFRISALPLEIPPLREREKDIGLLTTFFMNQFCQANQIRQKQIDPQVLEILSRYRWPGNVRELKNLCERLVILGGDPITKDQLPSSLFKTSQAVESGILPVSLARGNLPLREFKAQCEKEYIENVLQRFDWNFQRAAELLEIQRTYLYQKAQSLGIQR